MNTHPLFRLLLLLVLLAGLSAPALEARAAQPQAPAQEVSAYQLIVAMNNLRMSYGLPALIEDPIIDAVAQATAATMAANEMSWHIGNVSGRLAAAGYGGGAKVWATENFAMGNLSLDEIMVIWSDESHMLPAVIPSYCHVGAGTAVSPNGYTYYVLQAAYTAANSCGPYTSAGGSATQASGGTPASGASSGVPQYISPVKLATPDADGKIYHIVQAGQSLWAIAIAYKVTIKDLQTWNNLPKDSKLQIGQKLFIPNSNTAGYATPTPLGMVQISMPGADGKVVHTVQPYQNLTMISQAYNTPIETILALNNLKIDWPLQIGQKLLINAGNVTPSPTLRPLTPLEMLTPAADGKYYHTVKSGENLTYIANLYGVKPADLMTWNGLAAGSVIRPDQKLLLMVMPPPTRTPTPAPPTDTPTITPTPTPSPPTRTPSASPTQPPPPPPAGGGSNTDQLQSQGDAGELPNAGNSWVLWVAVAGLLIGGAAFIGFMRQKND